MKFQSLILEYCNFFSIKDSDSLETLLSEDIVLRDWNVQVAGKKKVIEEIKKIFDSTITIKITPISFLVNSDYSYAVHISILVNDEQQINVIDVINFDVDEKIAEIVAFKYENIS